MTMKERQKILIVDDREENLIALRQVLSELDAEIVDALSGNEALAATLDHHFAVAILDVMMPGMSGFELAAHLRKDERTQVIPIVFVTASFADELHMFKGYEAGGIDYIVKPYAPEMLLGKVKVFLELDRHREELRRHRDRLDLLVEERTAELKERVKEIRCLYAVSEFVAKPLASIEETLAAAVKQIPSGWQYPEITCARILLEGREFATARFRETPWMQSADIVLKEGAVGAVAVCYLEKRPERAEGPFLKEERDLIDDLARQLGVLIEKERARRREKHLETVLGSIRSVNQLIVHEKHKARLIQRACASLMTSRGFQGAWIILTADPPDKTEGAFAGFEDSAFNDLLARFRTGDPPPCCRPERDAGVTVVAVQANECRQCPLGDSHAGNAGMTVALRHNDRLYGWLGVSVPEAFASDPKEASLLDEIAGDLAFALHGMEVEAAREKSERFITAIFQSASDGILLAEAESGRFVMGNDAICRMLGCPAEEIVHLSVADIHPADSLAWVREQLDQQLKGEFILAPDIPVMRRDGTVFSADVSSAAIELDGRRYLLGIFRDITRRKEAEIALKESEEKYRTVVENAGEVLLVAQAGQIKFVNSRAYDIMGFTPEEMMETAFVGYIHPEDRDRVAGLHARRVEGEGVPSSYRFRVVSKEGQTRWVQINAVRIDWQQQPATLNFLADITDNIRAEEEHQKLQEQFQKAQKLEAVGRLTGGIAHDFNNILTTILGNAALMLSEISQEDALYEMIVEIKGAGEKASKLIRQLLAFSRKQVFQIETVNINEIVEEIHKMLSQVIGEDVELITDLASDLGLVAADVGQVEQVLMNLVVNARDALPEGGKLTIETANAELDEAYAKGHIAVKPGSYVMLAVSDTGIGMSREVQDHIFEPFFTTKEKEKGTGLGLATVYGIVKQSNGNIWTYSEPGKGTTFKIYLPRIEEKPDVKSKHAKKKKESLHGSETILIVEDEEAVRKMALKVLEKYGYHVLSAANGEEALGLSQECEDTIHLLLTDVIMPVMTGKTLADQIQKRRPDAKVLYMSGYTDNAIIHHGILDKEIAFLEKPFTPEGLARKVREVLDG
ncbi:MAG: PAS domain S-box protein [Desulfobacterales bacterium]|nr:PAS domain S-box protein [Desulfobacterales bacterium]